MKKVYLVKTTQFNEECYTGSVDPRKLVKLVDQSIDVGIVQEAQRPLDKKHIMDISDHVGKEQGILPTSIIVGTKDKRLKVETEKSVDGKDLFYIMFPDTAAELKSFENTIDISDGQHRVFAFSDKYRNADLKNSDVYEVPVTFYIMPSLETRRRIFYTTNAKQKTVSANLLLYLRDQLKLLNKDEETFLPLVRLLNSENASPLKGRIILSAETVSKGFKAKEILRILSKAKIDELNLLTNQNLTDDKLCKIISTYLNGWENKYSLSFGKPGTETMTKISGLRYIMLLLPAFIEISVSTKKKFDVDFVEETIKDLEDAKGIDVDETLFSNSLVFRGEGATVKMAEDDSKSLKTYVANKGAEVFDPFA